MKEQEAHSQHILMRALVDELARCGVAGACTSPGSRSTPLVVPLVRDGRIPCFSHIDERSAGFFALGLAKATGRPALLTCTSGTAAANYAPAVHEAREAGVPLLVVTADRPPELRDVGAGQVIDQVKLFGAAAKWFVEVGNHEATPERVRWMRTLACRAVWTALDGRPGVVHLNVPLRDPLVPPADLPAPEPAGRADGAPWLQLPAARRAVPDAAAKRLGDLLRDRPRGVVVVGRAERFDGAGAAAARFAERAGWPVLSDPLGGGRTGSAAIAHYDLLLRDDAFGARQRPEVVVRIGDLPTSKPLRGWLGALDDDVPQLAFAPAGVWHDPAGVLGELLEGDPAAVLDATAVEPAAPDWSATWRAADDAARTALETVLADGLSEPAVARALGATLAADATLVVASSMPVRDVETSVAVRDDPPRVLSNRGANGIDGTISTAYGVAASGARTVLLIGDVAFLHDLGGLLAGSRLELPLTIVLLDNDGGGIFSMLPISAEADVFEQHIATPHGLDLAHAAALFGCRHAVVEDLAALRDALGAEAPSGTTILHVRTDRGEQTALRRAVADAVREALSDGV